jgi:glycosyltransferase involved in cell wall biosynthesis
MGAREDLVSVVIPCHGQAHFLGEAIESVLAQTSAAYEIVVVDDGSPDDTARVAERYAGVRYVRQAQQERCVARNRGLRETSGSFVVFLDADDRLLPHHFESGLAAFRAHPTAAFVCGDYRWCGDDQATHVHDCRPLPDHYASLLRTNFIGPPHAVIFRRELVVEEGGFRVGFETCEDQDLYIRMARRHPIHCHHAVVAEYRRHGAQSSQRWDVMLRRAVAVMRDQYPYVKGHPVYEPAWQEGVERRRLLYGEPLLWATVAAVRSGHVRRALKNLSVLVRCYPRGLETVMRHKVTRLCGMGT